MALHFLSHSWKVRDIADGTLVTITYKDLDENTALLLVDELYELVQESGRPNLYLDFGKVGAISSTVLAQLLVLDRTLREIGGQLALFSLTPGVHDALQASQLANLLDVHGIPLPVDE
jgi:anti-anti-sigma factor